MEPTSRLSRFASVTAQRSSERNWISSVWTVLGWFKHLRQRIVDPAYWPGSMPVMPASPATLVEKA